MRTAAMPTWRGARPTVYVDIFRNVPFIVQLFFLFYGLPEIGVELSAFGTGVLALSLAGGAFSSDVIRAGILAIEPGVLEAAQVSGLSRLAHLPAHRAAHRAAQRRAATGIGVRQPDPDFVHPVGDHAE
jgi:ABC-type amino acid transport system permease subunit